MTNLDLTTSASAPKSTAKQRVLKALQSGPKTTAELMEAGGRNFPARLEELKRVDGIGHTTERLSQSSFLYRLAPSGTVTKLRPDLFWLCHFCEYIFKAPDDVRGCMSCRKQAHWLEGFYKREDALACVPLCASDRAAAA